MPVSHEPTGIHNTLQLWRINEEVRLLVGPLVFSHEEGGGGETTGSGAGSVGV